MAAHTHSHMQAHRHVHKHTHPHVYTQNNDQCARHSYKCFSYTNSSSSQVSLSGRYHYYLILQRRKQAQRGFDLPKSVQLLSHV